MTALPKIQPLPNIKKLFVPDPGYVICDTDLDRADLQVVVWEAGDDGLKADLRAGLDMHCANACDMFDIKGIPRDELKESHPNYKEHRARIGGAKRQKMKAGIHATNYYCQPRTLGRTLGTTTLEAERFQHRWFSLHPGVRAWHERIQLQLMTTRQVQNAFGFRRFYFDRIDSILPEALAWIPQSTVAIVTNKGIKNLYQTLPEVDVLLQVHDSTVWQAPKARFRILRPTIRECLLVEIPYDDPLVIPVGLKMSDTSWGDCKDYPWEDVA